jgi:hypothetical protein
MIGSLMSRMADAEKLSVSQLNQAVKNGTIPAYVGVPLIQEKMRAEQAAKSMVLKPKRSLLLPVKLWKKLTLCRA